MFWTCSILRSFIASFYESQISCLPCFSVPSIADEGTAVAIEDAPEYGLSGDWGGARTSLLHSGLDLQLRYKGDFAGVLSGGNSRQFLHAHNIDLISEIDFQKLANWSGAKLFVYGIGNFGAGDGKDTSKITRPSQAVGDLQWTSNIETFVDAVKLYELWFEQSFFDGGLAFLIGIHDLNSEFYASDSALLFLHSSFGLGLELSQVEPVGPSVFPYTTQSFRALVKPTESLYLMSAVFAQSAGSAEDPTAISFGVNPSQGFLIINEAGVQSDGDWARKYAVAYWTQTEPNGEGRSLSSGIYFMGDQRLTDWVSTFARMGFEFSHEYAVKDNFIAGFNFSGSLIGREKDQFGIGVSVVSPGIAVEGASLSPEWATELTYRFDFGHGVALQPDLQIISNPSLGALVDTAVYAAVRLEVAL